MCAGVIRPDPRNRPPLSNLLPRWARRCILMGVNMMELIVEASRYPVFVLIDALSSEPLCLANSSAMDFTPKYAGGIVRAQRMEAKLVFQLLSKALHQLAMRTLPNSPVRQLASLRGAFPRRPFACK